MVIQIYMGYIGSRRKNHMISGVWHKRRKEKLYLGRVLSQRKGEKKVTTGLILMGFLGVLTLGWVVIAQKGVGRMPSYLGVKQGHLAPCTSNGCVSTQVEGKGYMKPLTYKKSEQEVKSDLLSIIYSMDRARVVKEDDRYIHVEFMTPLLRLMDDVEFYIDSERKEVHFRSASRTRLLHSGANRKRMEEIRRRYLQRQ